MGDGVEQRSFQGLPGGEDLGLFRLMGQVDPFHGQGDLGDKGVEQAAMAGREGVGFFQGNPQNSEGLAGRGERQVEQMCGIERLRTLAGRPPVAITIARVLSVRVPSSVVTSTVQGEVMRASPITTSTPSAA